MKAELNLEPEIVLVTAQTTVQMGSCAPDACYPNASCDPNTNCYPFNCAPAQKVCAPDCAPAPPCYPTGKLPEPPRPPRPSCYPG